MKISIWPELPCQKQPKELQVSWNNNTERLTLWGIVRGELNGWQAGVLAPSEKYQLLTVDEALERILLPAYLYMLDNHCWDQVEKLKDILQSGKKIVVLDDSDNFKNNQKTLYDPSSSFLLKRYLTGSFPVKLGSFKPPKIEEEDEKQKTKSKQKPEEAEEEQNIDIMEAENSDE